MTQDRIEIFIMANEGLFPPEKIDFLRQRLADADEDRFARTAAFDFKNPTVMLIISVLLGGLGVDRFLLGEKKMGVLKLLTLGVCGILTVADWFSVRRKTRELNYNNLMRLLCEH